MPSLDQTHYALDEIIDRNDEECLHISWRSVVNTHDLLKITLSCGAHEWYFRETGTEYVLLGCNFSTMKAIEMVEERPEKKFAIGWGVGVGGVETVKAKNLSEARDEVEDMLTRNYGQLQINGKQVEIDTYQY